MKKGERLLRIMCFILLLPGKALNSRGSKQWSARREQTQRMKVGERGEQKRPGDLKYERGTENLSLTTRMQEGSFMLKNACYLKAKTKEISR